jgi:hypothetical protein
MSSALNLLISISIGSGAQGAVVVCTVSDLQEEASAEAEDWSFLLKRVVVVVDLTLHILKMKLAT